MLPEVSLLSTLEVTGLIPRTEANVTFKESFYFKPNVGVTIPQAITCHSLITKIHILPPPGLVYGDLL